MVEDELEYGEFSSEVEELYEKVVPSEFKEELRLKALKELKYAKDYRKRPDVKKKTNIWRREYYKKNRKKILAINKDYRDKRMECLSEEEKEKLREKAREYEKKQYWKNRDKKIEYGRMYRLKNKEKINKKRREKYRLRRGDNGG